MNVTEIVITAIAALIVGLIQGTIGLIMRAYSKRISDLETKIDEIPSVYFRRDDAKSQFDLIVSYLRRIEDKLDNKEDKRRG